MEDLISEYEKKKHLIKRRLKEFSNVHKGKPEDIFSELVFCLLTPQSKAILCDKAAKELADSHLLFKGSREAIRSKLKGVRFPNNKTAYIVASRKLFKNRKRLNMKSLLEEGNTFKTRERLVKHIKGLGYKEASHFLRNIGLGEELAILDVHILRNLKRYGLIKKIPASITKKSYLNIERKMKQFSRKIKIPLPDLDLLFWSRETGIIFK